MAMVKTAQIDDLMERASEALARTRYFEAERMALKALTMAHGAHDHERMSRILLPLQEARRQRWQMALDTGDIHIVKEPFGDEIKLKPGCYLVQPPLVGADARRLRLKALEQDVPAAVICREPTTQTRLIPVVAIGRVTIRTQVRPANAEETPTLEWLNSAMEALGDTAIEELDPALSLERRIEALMERLDAIPDHEKLHQALAETAREAIHRAGTRSEPRTIA